MANPCGNGVIDTGEDCDGTLLGAEISREFRVHHAALERDREVDHPFGPADDREMLPVLVHDGSGLRALAGVPIDH